MSGLTFDGIEVHSRLILAPLGILIGGKGGEREQNNLERLFLPSWHPWPSLGLSRRNEGVCLRVVERTGGGEEKTRWKEEKERREGGQCVVCINLPELPSHPPTRFRFNLMPRREG